MASYLFAVATPSAQQWQMRIGGAAGERVTGIEELEQSLAIIVQTELGSVPGRPGFGLRFDEILDAPPDTARAVASREVVRAVRDADPRISVLGATPFGPNADGHMVIEIQWQPAVAIDVEPRVTRVTV